MTDLLHEALEFFHDERPLETEGERRNLRVMPVLKLVEKLRIPPLMPASDSVDKRSSALAPRVTRFRRRR